MAGGVVRCSGNKLRINSYVMRLWRCVDVTKSILVTCSLYYFIIGSLTNR